MANTAPAAGQEFPHSLTINIPFPTHRLARIALRSLSVDEELSQLVRRSFALTLRSQENSVEQADALKSSTDHDDERKSVLRVYYRATTPRMLRVAVNGFFESIAVVVQVMEELDVDVLHEKGIEGLEGVQGVEEGMAGAVGTAAG